MLLYTQGMSLLVALVSVFVLELRFCWYLRKLQSLAYFEVSSCRTELKSSLGLLEPSRVLKNPRGNSKLALRFLSIPGCLSLSS